MAIKQAFMKQVRGITFVGKTDSGHWITIDGPENFYGSNAGIRPKELLLLSLAGCTVSDVVSVLQKKRVPLNGFESNITAEQSDEHPQVYTKINIEYFQSNIEGEIINKLHESGFTFDGIILNAAAYTHTSIAISDAVKAIKTPVIEVHISNIFARENYRHVSYLGANCIGSISGFGLDSYKIALKALEDYLKL